MKLVFVTHKWKPLPGYRSDFGARQVNVTYSMLDRRYRKPFEMVCFTDDSEGIDGAIRVLPLPAEHGDLRSPHGPGNPSCYRRLKLFSREMAEVIGPRFVNIDLDMVITADVTETFDRPEPFVIWASGGQRTPYNGGLYMMTAGAHPEVWETFDPKVSPQKAMGKGFFGSDQAWIMYCLYPRAATWTSVHGIYSYRTQIKPNGNRLPANAKIVSCHGRHDPWHEDMQEILWVRENWR